MKNNRKISADHNSLKKLPSVDALLQTAAARQSAAKIGAKQLTETAREAIANLRETIRENNYLLPEATRGELLNAAENELTKLLKRGQTAKLQRVINATGVIIHTNLGRAPLAANAVAAIVENAAGYCNLEYDLADGERGRRGGRAEKLLAEICAADDALIVNNCAAACVLVLTALAAGGEAIVSRGELVEIGGDFRIPDVMNASGAILKEVGTTNRTKIKDYAAAINENTKILVKIHPSNYRIVGFTETVSRQELAALAQANDILFYEDAGSGALIDLSEFGLNDEPVISDSTAAGADVVTFSADKLSGAAQAGLIVGRAAVIEKLRKHPLFRALRASKLIYAALEATLESFRREKMFAEIPVLRMLAISAAEIYKRERKFVSRLKKKIGADSDLRFEIVKGASAIGGGSAPTVAPETFLLTVSHREKSAAALEEILRTHSKIPVIARIADDKIVLDFRTVAPDEEDDLLEILIALETDLRR